MSLFHFSSTYDLSFRKQACWAAGRFEYVDLYTFQPAPSFVNCFFVSQKIAYFLSSFDASVVPIIMNLPLHPH